jgi:hypothetical protein
MGCLQNQLSLPPGEELYVTIVADDVRQIQTLPFALSVCQHDGTTYSYRPTARISASKLEH